MNVHYTRAIDYNKMFHNWSSKKGVLSLDSLSITWKECDCSSSPSNF